MFTQSSTSVCPNTNNVVYTVPTVSGANSYQWSYTGTGVTFSGSSNSVTANFAANATSGDVQVIAVGTCGNSQPQTVSVTVGAGGLTLLDNIVGPITACQNQTGLSYSITAISGATGYTWSVPEGATITSGSNTNTITITSGINSGNITVTPFNACETGNTKSLTLSLNALPQAAGKINGNTTVCANSLGESYSIANVNGATSYNWSVPTGASIISGAGSNVISVNWGTTSGNISVTPSNACGNGILTDTLITVNPLPTPAGAINGLKSVCTNQTGLTYTIATVNNATGYNWTVPTGATITSGLNTNSITVTMSTSSGNVSVTPINTCGNGISSTSAITVNPIISNTSAITGPTTVCANQTGASYSISPISGATYNWTVPSGASITAGNSTNAITVKFGTVSGDVTVTPSNSCGTGNISTLAISVQSTVSPSVSVSTQYMPVCSGTNSTFTANPVNGGSSPTYSWKINNKPQNGNNTATLTAIVKNNDVVYVTLNSNVACASTASAQGSLNITTTSAVPAKPTSFVTQTSTVIQGQQNVLYAINSVANTNTYAWNYSGTGATFSNTNTVSTSINYDNFATSGTLSITAINACGSSTALTLPITVNSILTTIDNNINSEVVFYQNGYLKVQSINTTSFDFDIIDMYGISVMRGTEISQVNVSELPTAMYIAKVKVNEQVYSVKFIR